VHELDTPPQVLEEARVARSLRSRQRFRQFVAMSDCQAYKLTAQRVAVHWPADG
jgi:hypothetical protein